jgi:peptidyl-prolyl cis-trans isomerase A (cyclophilin A)
MMFLVWGLQEPTRTETTTNSVTTTTTGTGTGTGTTASSSLEAQRLRKNPEPAADMNAPLLVVHAPPKMVSDTLEEAALLHPMEVDNNCPYSQLDDLTEDELHPKQGDRHMITPPPGGKLTLVCCQTTKGPMNIVAHHQWAPLGAARFVQMVTSAYFQTGVPMMRCIPKFLCQFGLNADPKKAKDFRPSLPDDPFWLPTGPPGRQNDKGVKRFAQGYLAYAGSGPQSRSNQLIVALEANGPLSGGSPWEVPWGELVGEHSFHTLSQIYTGYGEKGPPQGRLGREGFTKEAEEEWPLLDHILKCHVQDERVVD